VVEVEAAGEDRVADEAAPTLADEGCAREGGGMRGETEEDLCIEHTKCNNLHPATHLCILATRTEL
jgi:hypothetical protein